MKGLMESITCMECPSFHWPFELEQADIEKINSNRSTLLFPHNTSIVRQGTFVSQIFYLKQGLVKKVLEGKNDRNTIVKLVESGNFIALPVLGKVKKYPFSIESITDCELCVISKEAMLDIKKTNYEMTEYIEEWYANDYLYMYSKMAILSTRNSHGKVASSLLYLTGDHFNSDVLNLLSRKDIAELSATSVDGTNKILQQLNHDGIIHIEQNKIKIVRRDLLEKLSTVG